jgi:spermidine synthase
LKISKKRKSFVLKFALFATGISGIVAEYILSTLAAYFIGNAILQFTLIVSIMLFSMGLGSRISKSFDKKIIEYFIITELVLSVLVSFSALIAYVFFSFTEISWLIIYILSILVGILIGLEIPFATRINNEFESLRFNISSILEKDYYGSLIGGLFFAFVGLPHLGLTYTPFVLGILNFVVSLWLFISLKEHINTKWKRGLNIAYIAVGAIISLGLFYAKPIMLFGEQAKYKDKIVYQEQTKYQKIIVTQWGVNHSLFINGNQQLSTFDEFMYHEPMVHPIMQLAAYKKNILILGGGDGCIVRELLKYEAVSTITLIDLDPKMIQLAQQNPIFTKLNNNAMNSKKLTVKYADAFNFLEKSNTIYDIIFVDLPDPNNVDLNKLYSKEFYYLCHNSLAKDGLIITQAGSPYYATKAFYCINKTMKKAGFNTLPIHNQVLTLGEWGWVIGSKMPDLKARFLAVDFNKKLQLKWLNKNALPLLTSFGKPLVDTTGIEVNTIISPKLYQYYHKGNWELY